MKKNNQLENEERCQGCYSNFPIKKLKEYSGYYYCKNCLTFSTGREWNEL